MTREPLVMTAKDEDLLGVSNRSDAMGVLAIWSVRGRDLIPHLTAQTTHVQGFQILVEAFRLWELYESEHPQHAGRLDDFFLLVEQAFARTVGARDKDWLLPGSRRVRARMTEDPHISLSDPGWHLLGGQKANGLWGLYRGAARRAGLLAKNIMRLSDETEKHASSQPGIRTNVQARLFDVVAPAMDGNTEALPNHMNNKLTASIYNTYWEVPLANHLHARLVDGHDLNRQLAQRLLDLDELEHRTFLDKAARELPEHRAAIEGVVHCENLLAVVEAIFLWLCASKGRRLDEVVVDLPVNLSDLARARTDFAHSGTYRDGTARDRHRLFCEKLDTSTAAALARSVLLLHKEVSKTRGQASWVWEDQGILCSDMELEPPTDVEFQVGLAWRNDYYLTPLKAIAKGLAERCE